MKVRLFTDSSANLPDGTALSRAIDVVPLTLTVNGEELRCYEEGVPFDGDAFYARMKQDTALVVKTSMINEAAFLAAFEPCLQAGEDVVYIAMSSGISGTYFAGKTAAETLSARYPERTVLAVDTFGASLGEGMQVLEAAEMRERGAGAREIAAYLERRRGQMRQYFVVDDLMFLKRGGRISGAAALAGTIINMKPILKGDPEGRIVVDRKILGRKKALRELVQLYADGHADGETAVGIAHGGCKADADALAQSIREIHPAASFTIVCYEPGTGSHVGPGTVALFFWTEQTRQEKPPVMPAVRQKLRTEVETIRAGIENRLKKGE